MQKNKNKNKNKARVIVAIGVVSLIVMLLLAFLFYQVNLQPVTSKSEPVEFEVIEGDSIASVIDRLANEDLIKSSLVSGLYAKLNGLHNLKVGFFQLDPSWNTAEILRYLNDAKNAGEHQVSITFREGVWAKDIAAELENKLGVSASELLDLWNDDTYLQTLIEKYEFLDESILNEEVRVKLEGYLYPETYSFAKDASKEEITEIFLDQFAKVYKEIERDVKSSDRSLHELITLASMVQYESKTEEDMYMISGVFYNRLDINMSLGSSVTICYALYDEYKTAEDCEVNVEIESPYNTYKYPGLPVGPILNPGKAAILASLKPKESEYFYFMADIYGDGTVYYAKDLETHEANVNAYLR